MEVNELVYRNSKRYPKRRQWSIVGETKNLADGVFKKVTYMYGLRSVSEMTKDLITKELVGDYVLNAGNQNLRLDTCKNKTHPADSPFYDKNFKDHG